MSDIIPFAGRDGGGDAAASPPLHRQRFAVDYDYDVHFTRDVFHPDHRLLLDVLRRRGEDRRHRVFVCLDAGVVEALPDLTRRIKDWFHEHQAEVELVSTPEIVPGGEEVKCDWRLVQDLMVVLGNHHLDRQSFVLAIGGGSVLDMVGFVTALVHRGLRLIRFPTTVLAQNDAGVGVKNGMNEHGVKNFLGTFAPPFAVINDSNFLESLTDEHWRGGISEAFKVAIIKDREFFDELVRAAPRLRARDREAMESLVRKCAVLHLNHIASSGDPFELGTARPLDFGHWLAHKIEVLSGHRISHGYAVSAGVALDSFYACAKGFISEGDLQRILGGLTDAGLPIWHPEMAQRAADGTLLALAGLEEFREHLGGRLTITLPKPLGSKCEVNSMDPEVLARGVEHLRGFEAARDTAG